MFDLDQRPRLWCMPPEQPTLGLLGWEGEDAIIIGVPVPGLESQSRR